MSRLVKKELVNDMNQEQMSTKIIEHTTDIATLKEQYIAVRNRLDGVATLTSSVHELAQSNVALASEIKMLATNFDRTISRIEQSQISQGERLGELEKKGSKKLESIVGAIVTVIITAVVMYFVGG